MRTKLWATGAFLLFPCIPLACSAGGDTSTGPGNPFHSGGGNQGGSAGAVGAGGFGAGPGGANGAGPGGSFGAGPGGSDGAGPGGGGGLGGSGGMGGDGGMGAEGGFGGSQGGVGGADGAGGSGNNTSKDPVIPPVKGECPSSWNGTITFMGLGGIRVDSGTKPSSPTAPLLFYWHGTGSNSGEYSLMAGAVANGVKAEGGVIVSFQGTSGGDLNSGTSIFGAGDWNIADQFVACAVRDRNIDPHRIHATGCSAGGLFSDAMGVARAQYMASVASNSGGLVATPAWGSTTNTPALMTVHGGASDMVIVTFSQTSATADNAYKRHGGFVINCDHGGGHCGGSGFADDIWMFFKAHPFGVDPSPSPWTGGLPSGFSTQCKIF